jgi:hypothetical protein
MLEQDSKPFSKLSAPLAPSGLLSRIRERVAAAERRARALSASMFGALGALSAAALALVGIHVAQSLAASGSMAYLSLIFTDGAAVLPYLGELGMSVLESFPTLAVSAGFIFLASSLWSGYRLNRTLRAA